MDQVRVRVRLRLELPRRQDTPRLELPRLLRHKFDTEASSPSVTI
jgi:hypothetical protein